MKRRPAQRGKEGACLRVCMYVCVCVRACVRAFVCLCVRACVRVYMRASDEGHKFAPAPPRHAASYGSSHRNAGPSKGDNGRALESSVPFDE